MLQTIAPMIISCLNIARARGAVRGLPGAVIGTSFHLVAIFFSMIFMTLFFSQKNAKIFKKVTKSSLKL